MSNIILFDMDGTLTLPRKLISREMVRKLKELSNFAEIGIVTGSGYDYLTQQCKEMWHDIGTVSPSVITLLPCNGTQVYSTGPKPGKFILKHRADMRQELGNDCVDIIMRCLLSTQYSHCCSNPDHPLTGHFVSYRGSLINWCPVGRNANHVQREKFIEYDKKYNIRVNAKNSIEKYLIAFGIENISIALGGSTSIDIFPNGWDKTYALQHFPGKQCWFVGDSCTGNGNDKTIYDYLLKSDRAYMTSTPGETIQIIDKIINLIKKEST
jgi:phosphomannomutase